MASVAAHVFVSGSLPRVHHGIRTPRDDQRLHGVKNDSQNLVLRREAYLPRGGAIRGCAGSGGTYRVVL